VRVEQGLSQMQVAARAKVHHNYISRLEQGKAEVSVGVLVRITKALRINVSDLWPDGSAQQ
jgi:transcriptional regulator with XRE-family HTH domain